MNKEPNVRFNILLFKIEWSQEKIDIVNPYHVPVTLELQKVLNEFLVDVAVCMPHFCVLLIDLIFIHAFEIVKKRSHKLLVEEHILFYFLFCQPDRNTVLRL